MTQPIVEQLREHLHQLNIDLTELADGTSVLLDLSGHQVLSLNKTGSFLIGRLLTEKTGKDDLVDGLSKKYHIDRRQAEADVDEFLNTLANTVRFPL